MAAQPKRSRKQPRSKSAGSATARALGSGRWALAFLALTAGIVWTGLSVVESAQSTRALYQALDHTQRTSDQLLEEQSRLSLEIGAISSLQEVEQIALSELDMAFPEVVRRVEP